MDPALHAQLLQAVDATLAGAAGHPPLPTGERRLFEDDLRTFLAINLHPAVRVRTPSTTSRCPDLVLNETAGVQMKYSCCAQSKSRMSISAATLDFDWFCQRGERRWGGPRAWVVFWDNQEKFRRVNVYKDCVKADKVGWMGQSRRTYKQNIFEPVVGLVHWATGATPALVFRQQLVHGAAFRMNAQSPQAGYPYRIDVRHSPFGNEMWASIYSYVDVNGAPNQITYAPDEHLPDPDERPAAQQGLAVDGAPVPRCEELN
jgi:hypothetical protein